MTPEGTGKLPPPETLAGAEPGREQVLAVEDWAEIRGVHRAEQMPIRAIARVMGLSKNTVKAALRSDGPPKYERTLRGSVVDEVEPRIRELLSAWPTMPATVIAERIGWTRSIRVLSDRVAELRPVYLPPDPAGRTTYLAGEIASATSGSRRSRCRSSSAKCAARPSCRCSRWSPAT